VPRIAADRAHAIEIKRLSVEDVIGETLFEQFDQIFRRTFAHKAGLHASLLHHLFEIAVERQGNSSRACLEGEAVAHDSGIAQESCNEFSDAQTVRRACDLGTS